MIPKNELERLVSAHREAFDTERPSLKVWADIERSLPARMGNRRGLWQRNIAAVLVLLVGVSLGLLIYPRYLHHKHMQIVQQSTEVEGIESYFNGEVNARLARLLDGQIADAALMNEMAAIEENIADLKSELIYAPRSSREMILQAIITSYETKIELLERGLQQQPLNDKNHEQEYHL